MTQRYLEINQRRPFRDGTPERAGIAHLANRQAKSRDRKQRARRRRLARAQRRYLRHVAIILEDE